MRISVIIPAAGRSERFGASDKLSQDVGGRSLLLRAIEPFTKIDEVVSIIVAGPPQDMEIFRDQYGAKLGFLGATIVEGGPKERWETVKNALALVPDDATHVAVHDAARPIVEPELIQRIFEAARSFPAVVPGLAVNDTLKRVAEEVIESAQKDATVDSILGIGEDPNEEISPAIPARSVEDTVSRDNLVLVQTPQIFDAALFRRAYEQDDLAGATDDAMLVERLGEPVLVVEGDSRNIKVTKPSDLDMVRRLLGVKAPSGRPVHKRF